MPAGKYSFYLYTDDRTDVAAMATISTISQPLRGDFIRTAALAGCAVYRTDVRLPELVTDLFDGQLGADQFLGLCAVLSGEFSRIQFLRDRPRTGMQATISDAEKNGERRRFTLLLPDAQTTGLVESVLDESVSRLRGQRLRQLIITGFALHTLDSRLPRLLSSLPVLPATVPELYNVVAQLAGAEMNNLPVTPVTVNVAEPHTDAEAQVRKNMKRAFE